MTVTHNAVEILQRPGSCTQLHATSVPTNQSQDAFTIYHQVQEQNSSSDDVSFLPSLGHALAGSIGTAVSNVAIYPLDLVITRLQCQERVRSDVSDKPAKNKDDQYTGTRDAITKIYRYEGGLPAFYSGVLPDTIKSMADSFLFFLAYNLLLRLRKQRATPASSSALVAAVEKIGIGCLAGALSKAVTTPLASVVVRKQTTAVASAAQNPDGAPRTLGRQQTTREIVAQIYRERGLLGFWSGYAATIFLTLNPSMTFYVESFLKKLLRVGAEPGLLMAFLPAALAKAFASTALYPLSLAKARSQAARKSAKAEDGAEGGGAPRSVLTSIPYIARKEGVQALYAGVAGEVLKGFFAHGLTMLVKERIHAQVIAFYMLLAKLLGRLRSKMV